MHKVIYFLLTCNPNIVFFFFVSLQISCYRYGRVQSVKIITSTTSSATTTANGTASINNNNNDSSNGGNNNNSSNGNSNNNENTSSSSQSSANPSPQNQSQSDYSNGTANGPNFTISVCATIAFMDIKSASKAHMVVRVLKSFY